MTDRFDVIGVSALNVDRVLRVDALDRLDNEMVVIDETVSPGGSAANTVRGLARLGISAALVGAVGADRAGKAMLGSFSDAGIPTHLIDIKDAVPTGESICFSDKHGRRLIAVNPGANDRLIDADIIGQIGSLELPARLIHLSSFVGDRQFTLQVRMAEAASPSSIVSLSPGSFYARRGIAAVAPLAARCDVLFVNGDEICALMAVPAHDYAVAARRFLDEFARCETVVVTLGAGDYAGIGLAARPDPVMSAPSQPAGRVTSRIFGRSRPGIAITSADRPEVVDTTGAGDAFAAGYLYGLLSREDAGRCALFGHTLAQFVISGMGACANLPSLAEFRRTIDRSQARPMLM